MRLSWFGVGGLAACGLACGVGDAETPFGDGTQTGTGAGTTGTSTTTGTTTTTVTTTSTSTSTSTSTTTTTTSGTGGAGGKGQGGAGPDDPIGCSDGTREGYLDVANQPKIAACSGGFSVAGVTTPDSMSPQCGRVSGNDSINPNGQGCSIEDLCSEGWHVCKSSEDVAQHSTTGQCEPNIAVTPVFWLTRQSQDEQANCAPPPATNNLVGCGTFGAGPGNNCEPLDQRLRVQECIPTAAWYCGNGNNDGAIEADIVFKVGPAEGGVLCCTD